MTRLSDDKTGILISAAGAAPSMHNTQPWRFEVAGGAVDVMLDADRALPAEDPAGRLVRIGLGAAGFNLRVAAAMLGYDARYAVAPDPERRDIVVRVFLGERRAPAALSELYPQVHRRHTYRGPMLELHVPPAVRGAVGAAVRHEGGELTWLTGASRERLLGVVLEAEVLDGYDEDRRDERARWIGGGGRRRDGVPAAALGPRPASRPAPHRDLDPDGPDRGTAAFEPDPQLAVLSTPSDGPEAWVVAGMALQHGLLEATSYDVSASFVNQPVEHTETRRYLRELADPAANPQLVIRFGYPAAAAGHAPRRAWQELMED